MKYYCLSIISWFIIVYFIFIVVSCSNTPAKPVEIPASTTIPISTKGLDWNIPEWDKILTGLVAKELPNLDAAEKDMERFCPGYARLDNYARVYAWSTLIVAIVKRESGYNPKSKMTESNGDVSQGLLQLTYGNSFCPRSKSEGDLDDPRVNLSCGVQIIGSLVKKDKLVASGGYTKYGAPPAKGAARYFSVLRVSDSHRKHHLSEIINRVRSLDICK